MSVVAARSPVAAMPGRRSATIDAAVCLALTAALAHAVGTPAHLRGWLASGLFFLALSIGQALLAGALFGGASSSRLLVTAVWAHVAVVALYVWSRTAGLPFAPPVYAHGGSRGGSGRSIVPGAVEKVGSLDLPTLGAELLLVLVLVSMMDERVRRLTTTEMMAVGLALWGLAAIGVLA